MINSALAKDLDLACAAAVKFWFESPEHRKRWFASTPQFDAAIGASFGQVLEQVHGYQPRQDIVAWPKGPLQRLGLILLCDQFPRNLYRGQAKAFAFDAISRAVAHAGVLQGDDRTLGLTERVFFYLPFEHSESRVDQHLCVGLITELRDTAEGDAKPEADRFLEHAVQHRDIILRFGRFPHRNAALGRSSTPEEAEFAKGGSFGQ